MIGIISIPSPKPPYSKIVFSSNGQLLGARLATDEQWRFEAVNDLPEKYKTALTLFEDQYFQYHPGFNPISIFKALIKNIIAGKIVSGGSTITMQDIRLRRGYGKKRNFFNKVLELYWSIALELQHSKGFILKDYAGRAPFGSNVIGFETACWRYFDKPAHLITWAEASLLAVLPNNPAMLHPGRNRNLLKQKRDLLLRKLLIHKKIDLSTYQLALLESIPDQPKPLPMVSPHALDYLIKTYPEKNNFNTTLDFGLQEQVNEVANFAYLNLEANQIKNLAILIADTESGRVLAYCGNAPNTTLSPHVDHIQAPRSTGSILKPFLYTGANYRGKILPNTLLMDVPSVIEGFQPKNFSLQYLGAVHADQALIQSLNIPFVLLLQLYGVEQFHQDLHQLGLHQISQPPNHYGLSLILGGAESSLWDITGAYSYLARTLMHYHDFDRKYSIHDLRSLNLLPSNNKQHEILQNQPVLFSAASIYKTMQVIRNVNRPDELGNLKYFSTQMPISWKTGTSYGFRDAWAVGVNSKYTIGIWVGNSSGEGRTGLLGIKAAAPILFDIISRLPEKSVAEFSPPLDEMIRIPICNESGMKAGEFCNHIDTIFACRYQNITMPCTFHKKIYLDAHSKWRVDQSCISSESISKSIFNLPSLPEYYYAPLHAEYEKLPPMSPGCTSTSNPMSFILPTANSVIYIPKDEYGKPGKIVFKLAHRSSEATVYWHLDENYIYTTLTFHEIAVHAEEGNHIITVIDEKGNELKLPFKVIAKSN